MGNASEYSMEGVELLRRESKPLAFLKLSACREPCEDTALLQECSIRPLADITRKISLTS